MSLFSIDIHPFGPKQLIMVRSGDGFGMEILPNHGAALNALFVPDPETKTRVNLIDGYLTPDEAEKVGESFKGVILFPFGNRIKDGKWSWKGVDYAFKINEPDRNNALHGILYNRSFDLVEASTTNDAAKIHLRYSSDGEDPGFPFLYNVDVEFILSSKIGLEIRTTVSNRGEVEFPFSLGWHPYFKTGCQIDNLKLKLAESEMIEVDDTLIPTGKVMAFDRFKNLHQIGSEVIDSGFALKPVGKEIAALTASDSNIQISLHQISDNKDFEFLQIYTPPHRSSIALEPMTHPANQLAIDPGSCHILRTGQKRSFGFLIGY